MRRSRGTQPAARRAASVADPKRSAPAATRPRPVACLSKRAGKQFLSCESDDHCDGRNRTGDADLRKEVLALDREVRCSREEQHDAQYQPGDYGWQLEMASNAGHGITQINLLSETSSRTSAAALSSCGRGLQPTWLSLKPPIYSGEFQELILGYRNPPGRSVA